jgi:hypothetical protein
MFGYIKMNQITAVVLTFMVGNIQNVLITCSASLEEFWEIHTILELEWTLIVQDLAVL